jgi:hypothetical protein
LSVWNKAQSVAGEIKQIGLPQHAFIQFHDDQVPLRGNCADRLPRVLPCLGVCQTVAHEHDAGQQKSGAQEKAPALFAAPIVRFYLISILSSHRKSLPDSVYERLVFGTSHLSCNLC